MAKEKKKIWFTRDGKKIPITEMTTMHIMNAIDMFENTDSRKEQVKWLKAERSIRLGIEEDGPVENRWSILDLRKDDDFIGDPI